MNYMLSPHHMPDAVVTGSEHLLTGGINELAVRKCER